MDFPTYPVRTAEADKPPANQSRSECEKREQQCQWSSVKAEYKRRTNEPKEIVCVANNLGYLRARGLRLMPPIRFRITFLTN